ncbi:DUF2065 domain-containing protein [Tropicimonas sp. IMCC34043]|uniref:DUF2065 domain-containing protein n=1 Tax=Tropicimonas sp. IMCC34043 TaxID=2248760 RepID=UPI000E264992|nr:DUF2065 domain-containing protein [Tropicimonas sp. IMCC34043]
MIATLFLALGLVFVVEGLVLALAPSRLEEIMAMLAQMPPDLRRLLGLLAVTLGGILLWLANWLSA